MPKGSPDNGKSNTQVQLMVRKISFCVVTICVSFVLSCPEVSKVSSNGEVFRRAIRMIPTSFSTAGMEVFSVVVAVVVSLRLKMKVFRQASAVFVAGLRMEVFSRQRSSVVLGLLLLLQQRNVPTQSHVGEGILYG